MARGCTGRGFVDIFSYLIHTIQFNAMFLHRSPLTFIFIFAPLMLNLGLLY